MRKTLMLVSFMILAACSTTKNPPPAPVPVPPSTPDVVISHKGQSQNPAGTIHRRRGSTIHVQVRDTDFACYALNFKVLEEPADKKQGASGAPAFTDTANFYTTFWGDPINIVIEARLLPGADDQCKSIGGERVEGGPLPPWQVRVTEEGWDVHFSGAFSADKLTDPVFALIPTKKDVDNDKNTPDVAGFKVIQSRGASDSYRLGAVAMAHVIHSDPDRLNFGSIGSFFQDINWVPISFGLGVGDNSQARYYLGTGLRFGQKFFLTAGAALGPVKRLPATLSLDPNNETNFTTDANVLSSLPTRNRGAFFIAASYTFAGVGPSFFTGPFTSTKPDPAEPAKQPGEDAKKKDPELSTENKGTLANKMISYDIVIKNPCDGNDLEKVTLKHATHDDAKKVEIKCKKDDAACGADVKVDKFPIEFDLPADTNYVFTVTTTFNSDNPAKKKLPISIEHASIKDGKVATEIEIP